MTVAHATRTLYFVRHGESTANVGAPAVPDALTPLTERGQQQARTLLQRWPVQPRRLYCSGLLRARQTAQVFADAHALELHEQPLLNELNCLAFARVEGMPGTERFPLVHAYWDRADPAYRDGEVADSFNDFQARVDAFLGQLEQFEDGSVLFGHGIWIGLLAWRLLGCRVEDGAGMRRFRQFQLAIPLHNTIVYRLDLPAGFAGRGAALSVHPLQE